MVTDRYKNESAQCRRLAQQLLAYVRQCEAEGIDWQSLARDEAVPLRQDNFPEQCRDPVPAA